MIAEGIRKSQTVTERGSSPRYATNINAITRLTRSLIKVRVWRCDL